MEYTRIREYAWQRAKRERKKTEAAAATKKAKKIIMYWKECERRETEQLSTFANCANCESRRVPCRCVCTFVRAVQCYSRPVSNAIYTKLYAHEEESVAIIIIIIIDTFEVVCNGQGIGGAITQLPNGWCVGCEQLKYVVILSSLVGSHRIELITFRSLTVVAAVDLSVCVFIYIYLFHLMCAAAPWIQCDGSQMMCSLHAQLYRTLWLADTAAAIPFNAPTRQVDWRRQQQRCTRFFFSSYINLTNMLNILPKQQ